MGIDLRRQNLTSIGLYRLKTITALKKWNISNGGKPIKYIYRYSNEAERAKNKIKNFGFLAFIKYSSASRVSEDKARSRARVRWRAGTRKTPITSRSSLAERRVPSAPARGGQTPYLIPATDCLGWEAARHRPSVGLECRERRDPGILSGSSTEFIARQMSAVVIAGDVILNEDGYPGYCISRDRPEDLLLTRNWHNPLTAELFNGNYLIFTHLRLWIASEIHNFKWLKIIQIWQNGD